MTANTANTSDVYSGNVRPEDVDEIDVRRYFLILLKWWREILAISIFAGLIAGLTLSWLNTQKPVIYSADADILIARLLSTIELDSRVSTSTGTNQNDLNGWRTSLLQLSRSSSVATAVFNELRSELPDSWQSPERLMGLVAADVPLSPDARFSSNIIRITVSTTDPELSALIANSWARHLVDHINGLYGEVPESTIVSVTTELDNAFADYQAAQRELETFIANNQIDGLTRQIQQKNVIRNEMMTNYASLLTSIVSNEYNSRLGLHNTLESAPMTHAVALINAQSSGTIQALNSLYEQRSSAIAQLNQARSMEESLVVGGVAAAKSNITALQLLKLGTFAAMRDGGALPILTSSAGAFGEIEMTLDEQLTDVRALIGVLEEYVTQLDGDIAQLAESSMVGAELNTVGGLAVDGEASSVDGEGQMTPTERVIGMYTQLLNPDGLLDQLPVNIDSTISESHEKVLSALELEIQALQAELAAENTRQRELTHQRDLAWTTYDTVGNKLEELKLLRSSANTEVRIGNPAIAPLAPEPKSSPLMPVVGVTLLGFFMAVVLALLVNSVGGSPFFTRRTA